MSFRDLPEKVNILIARLSYNGYERVEIANWLCQTVLALDGKHPRVGNVAHKIVMGYPTPRVRNQVIALGLKRGFHFAVMIDDDIIPDVHSRDRAVSYGSQSEDTTRAPVMTDPLPIMRDQCNFFPAALDFALEHPGPCVIGAPYCAGPPEERVLVSRFRERQSDDPNAIAGGLQLECFTRDESALRTGIEMVSSLPTGLILIDLRVCDVLSAPWFSYEYQDDTETELASTEDTVFSRNAMFLGVPQYCTWQSFAAHAKTKIVGRPRKLPSSAIPPQVEKAMREQIAREQRAARPADKPNERALQLLSRLYATDDDAAPVLPFTPDEEPHPNGDATHYAHGGATGAPD